MTYELYGSPWVHDWSSDSIHFYSGKNSKFVSPAKWKPLISSPLGFTTFTNFKYMALFRLVDMLREIAGVWVDPNVDDRANLAAELVVTQLGEKYQQVVKRCLDCANYVRKHHGERDFNEEVDRYLGKMLQKLHKCAEASDIFS